VHRCRGEDAAVVLSLRNGYAGLHKGLEEDLPQYFPHYQGNNHIRAIDTTLYTQSKLQLIDLSKNKLSNMKNVIDEARGVFAYLKVLKIGTSSIMKTTT
jgi:hypothetical protein